ncbi:MAG: ABC transporter transmembrane domain-containing protein, partial [Planctomycetota bacterium]|nr:ABC transporter transmembrane domain-containing protein [Planctomycetota bacterium]
MHSFSRIFRYVWPQWPRIISVVLTSFLQAVLFSLSFATIVPLLKVMMGEEGLHGWVDRSVCKWQYGMDFYIPDKADFTSDDEQNIAYYLLVTDIKESSLAQAAGLAEGDRIIGAGRFLVGGDIEHVNAPQILEELARTAQPESINVQFRKFGSLGSLAETNLSIPGRQSRKDQFRWKAVQTAEWAVSFLPRNQAKSNKARAVVFIIVVMMGVTVFRCAARFHQGYLAEKIVQVAMSRLREDLFDHIMHIPVGFFSNKGTSDTTSRMLNDISISGKGIKILLGKTLREPLTAMGTLTIAMMINWKLTLIFMTAGPPTLVMIGLLGRKIKKATKRSLMSSAVMLGRIQEAMGALGVVKVYNRQDYETSLYRNANQTFLRRQLRSVKIEAATNPIMEVLGMFAGSAA